MLSGQLSTSLHFQDSVALQQAKMFYTIELLHICCGAMEFAVSKDKVPARNIHNTLMLSPGSSKLGLNSKVASSLTV